VTRRAPTLIVSHDNPDDAADAQALAASLGIDCAGPGRLHDAGLCLRFTDQGLALCDHRSPGLRPLLVDLEAAASPSKRQHLGRAVGRRTRTVLDATAGWGEDTRRLCAMGFSVTAVERDPVMAALLADAAARAKRSGHPAVPEIVRGDAVDLLERSPGSWDCVYLDPMFPPKRRTSALARRRMRLLRDLAGDDRDQQRLFDAARAAAMKRVVVKRPDRAAPSLSPPTEVIKGKLVCYDVYHLR